MRAFLFVAVFVVFEVTGHSLAQPEAFEESAGEAHRLGIDLPPHDTLRIGIWTPAQCAQVVARASEAVELAGE